MKKITILYIAILYNITILLLVVSCSGSASAPAAVNESAAAESAADAPSDEEQTAESEPDSDEVDATESQAEIEPDSSNASESGQSAEASVTESKAGEDKDAKVSAAEVGPPPEYTPELKATDPNKVMLGNGKPQVIEFFAFW